MSAIDEPLHTTLGRVDTDYAYSVISDMATKLTRVWAGSPQEKVAADYIAAELAKSGLQVRFHTLRGHVSHPGAGRLEVLGREGATELTCNVMAQTEPAVDFEAPVAYVANGGFGDYAGVDVRGKVVIVDLSYSPPRPEKMRIAKLHGAAGMIMINWGDARNTSIPYGTTKYVWGNPTRDQADDMITLPGVAITRPDGDRLLAQLEREPGLRVRINAEVERKWRELLLPYVWVGEGEESDREFVLVAGHYDNWGGGATDNLSGDAALVALAKHFHSVRDHLQRDILFAWWPAHESGIMIGSTWFADSHWRLLRDRASAYVNIDQLGMGDYSRWFVEASGEMRYLIQASGTPESASWERPHKYGDQSFFGVGLPSTNCFTGTTEEEKAANNGMTLGFWYHSDQDTIEQLNPKTYAEGIERNAEYIGKMVGTPVLPFKMTDVSAEIVDRLTAVGAEVAGNGWDADGDGYAWSAVLGEADAFARAAEEFDSAVGYVETGDQVRRANAAMRRVSRLTIPVRMAATDRYGQDTYGQARLVNVLPELQVLIERSALEDGDEQRWFMDAEIHRALNRLSDALVESTVTLVDAVGRLRD
jgi:hypothetical protein